MLEHALPNVSNPHSGGSRVKPWPQGRPHYHDLHARFEPRRARRQSNLGISRHLMTPLAIIIAWSAHENEYRYFDLTPENRYGLIVVNGA